MRRYTLASLLLAACSPYNPDLGENVPYLCNEAEPRCPSGYTCQDTGPDAIDKKCVIEGGTVADAGPDTNGFPCANDGALEPNDSHMTAYVTDVAQAGMRAFGPLSICPVGDKDTFSVPQLPANMGLEAVATVESGAQVSVVILNAGGTTIGPSTMKDAKTMRACVTNLPMGTYHVQTFGPPSVQQNYRVQMRVVANCAQ